MALRWASRNGRLEVVKYLVENGANIHALDNEALKLALEENNLEIIKYLISKMNIEYVKKKWPQYIVYSKHSSARLFDKFSED